MEILCVYSIYIYCWLYIHCCISFGCYNPTISSFLQPVEQFVHLPSGAVRDTQGLRPEFRCKASGLFKSALSKARCRGIPTNLRILGGLIMKHRVNRVSHGLSIKHDGSKILKWDEMGANITYNANMLIEYMLETAFIWTPKSVHSRRSQGRVWGIWYFADGIKCHHTSQVYIYTYIYICICICRISSLIHWVFQNVK